jgi:DNA polymerase (family 10)
MQNKELAAIFSTIADLLEIQGEKAFRVNSYRRTARTLKDLTQDVAELAATGGLADLPGIGKGTVAKIAEYLADGAISLHSELIEAMPPGLPDLLDIPGMGPKKVALAWKSLGVCNAADLKRVIASGELATLKGLGEKSVAQIAAGIAFAEQSAGRTPLGMAEPLAAELVKLMQAVAGVRRVEIAGSLRRGCETVGDLDLLCESDEGESVIQAFAHLPQAVRVLAAGATKGSILVECRDGRPMQVDCRVVPAVSFGAAWQYFTGSKEHNVRLRARAVKKKWKLSEWGLFDGDTILAGADEAGVYETLGLPLIPPELREDRGEFDADDAGGLITLDDIRGDLHVHTDASDGTTDPEALARAAAGLGFEYIAVTDHSKSSVIADGLSIDKMWRHIETLRRLNERLDTITVLIGTECDILSDGSLDYPDKLLAACDFVVASVHSAMRQDRARVTARILAAMESPFVSAIGHPTGRLIARREPMDLDMAAVIAKAAETDTALELNAAWQRLDLRDAHVRMAREAGVMISIATDAHSIAQLDQMRYGITTARRGGLRPESVINTLPLPTLRKWIAKKRKA